MPTIPALDVEALKSQVQGHRLEHKELKAKVTHRPSQENKTNKQNYQENTNKTKDKPQTTSNRSFKRSYGRSCSWNIMDDFKQELSLAELKKHLFIL